MTTTIDSGKSHRTNRGSVMLWSAAGALLLLPLVAMQFTREVDWTASDFVVFGVMLTIACGTYELAARMARNNAYQAAVGVALVAGFALVWINLAVGIIGNEGNPANLMYCGVLAVGIAGACIARFRAGGMARALVATAAAQASVAAIALAAGWANTLVITAVFVALWLTSALLFRKAAREGDAV